MDDGKTYADKRTSEVWRATHGLGPDKKKMLSKPTIFFFFFFFADGKPPLKALIFQGKGLRIKSKEQDAWDRSVQVLIKKRYGVTNK